MEQDLLSVEGVAEILGLHPRTVRRFIREGRLGARKIGKQWRVRRSQLETLTGTGSVVHGPDHAPSAEDIQVSVVVDIGVAGSEEASRIFNSVLAAVVAKGPEYGNVRYESVYLAEARKARLLLWGDATFLGNLLITVNKVSAASQ